MSQKYGYRSLVRQLYWIAFSILIVSQLIVLRVNINEIMTEPWYRGVIKLVLASTLILSLFFRLIVFIRPRVFAIHELNNTFLNITRGRKESQIDFSQIKGLRLSLFSPRFFGGFWIYLLSGQKFFISSLLDGSGDIFSKIIDSNPQLLSSQKAVKFLKLLNWSAHSWERMVAAFKNIPFMVLKFLLFPLAFSFTAFKLNLNIGISAPSFYHYWWGVVMLCFFCYGLLNHIEERIIFFRYCRDGKVDSKFEKRVFYVGSSLCFVLPILIMVLFWS